MPSEKELKSIQKNKLFMLLTVKFDYEKLDDFISQVRVEMDKEDIADVEKEVKEWANRQNKS